MDERLVSAVSHVKSIHIQGFKSIRDARVDLGRLNVLIGANGAGKSNLLSVFQMISYMMTRSLKAFVGDNGHATSLLHYGPKRTPRLAVHMTFETEKGENEYHLALAHASRDSLIFVDEQAGFTPFGGAPRPPLVMEVGESESRLPDHAREHPTAGVVQYLLSQCKVFQFHDTSKQSAMRSGRYVGDNRFLRSDGGNLPAFLLALRETRRPYYDRIVAAIKLVAPFFTDFVLDRARGVGRDLFLDWRDTDPEGVFGPHLLSDGTLRAIALITLLLQPEDEMPRVVLIDEPELGLHPFAIDMVVELIRSASTHSQIIVATQSPRVVDRFAPSEVVIADRRGGETVFSKKSDAELADWLQEYTLGQLWERNVLGGRPA